MPLLLLPLALSRIHTLADLFAWRVAETPSVEAYREYDSVAEQWIGTTWTEAAQRTDRFVAGLSALGLARGARIAILLPNGLDAVCLDQAALALACTPAPMHALDNPGSRQSGEHRLHPEQQRGGTARGGFGRPVECHRGHRHIASGLGPSARAQA